MGMRLERTTETAELLAERVEDRGRQLEILRAAATEDQPDEAGLARIEALEAQLSELEAEHEHQLSLELEGLQRARGEAETAAANATAEVEARREALREADEAAEIARRALRAAETTVESARREASRVGAELAAANQFLRTRSGALHGAASLADDLEVAPGFERAVAAALHDRLRAGLADDVAEGHRLLDAAGADGGRVLVVGDRAPRRGDGATPPQPGARRLADLISGPERAVAGGAAAVVRRVGGRPARQPAARLYRRRGHTRRPRVARRDPRAAPGAGGRRGPRARRAQPA